MSKHETPLTRRYWREQVGGTLALEHLVVRQTGTNGREVHWQDLDIKGKDIICVQTKAARLCVHLIGQAFFSRKLLLCHGSVRSVRTVALCSADDAVLGPIAQDLGIEVVVVEGHVGGGSSLKHTPSWVTRWHAKLGRGGLIKHLRVVQGWAEGRGSRSVYAVVDLDGPAGERSGRTGVDVRGHDLVAITTTTGRPGMYSVGEALVNRILLVQQGGARSVRSVVLCGQADSVMDPLAAELGIEVVVMEPDAQ